MTKKIKSQTSMRSKGIGEFFFQKGFNSYKKTIKAHTYINT